MTGFDRDDAGREAPIRVVASFFGRVQGVGFRDYAIRVARGFAVAGTVRNVRADASVEIEAEGAAGAVEAFLHALTQRLEPGMHVERVERTGAAVRGMRGFTRAETR